MMVEGDAEMVQVGACGAGVTVTVFSHVTVPPAPVAVRVYFVVCDGVTDFEPESATAPTF